MADILEKKRAQAERANEAFADTLVNVRKKQQKQRNGRLIKLGVAVEQMVLAGDTTLLARLKTAIAGTGSANDKSKPIASRAVDKRDFALDQRVTWFDEMEQKALEHRAGGPREVALGGRAGSEVRAPATRKEGAAGAAQPEAPAARAAAANGTAAPPGAAASGARSS